MTSTSDLPKNVELGHGDLLDSGADALVNTVNTVGVMGKGIALQFKRRYPANYQAYREACARQEVQIGRMFVFPLHQLNGPHWIINFPTKRHWRSNSRLDDIAAGMQDFAATVRRLGIKSVAVPPLGAGNGGLEWSKVRPVILRTLAELPSTHFELFEPSRLASRPIDGQRVRMTRSRAVLLALLREYVARRQAIDPWESAAGASHLEIQKLMYFADRADPSMRLRYVQGHFGPYSDVVRIMISEMEGWYLVGHGDGTSPTLDLKPIALTEQASADLAAYEQTVEGMGVRTQVIEPVLHLIDGFESPLTLELLASVHWASEHLGTSQVDGVHEYIARWTNRKQKLFDEHQISVALVQLGG